MTETQQQRPGEDRGSRTQPSGARQEQQKRLQHAEQDRQRTEEDARALYLFGLHDLRGRWMPL